MNTKPNYPRNVRSFVGKWEPEEPARRKAFWKEFRKAANAYVDFKNNMKIIDNLKGKESGKKIELLYCLQEGNVESPYFLKTTTVLSRMNATRVVRLGKLNYSTLKFDIIQVDDLFLFLGHWNDGEV